MKNSRHPNFIIVGAPKAGTTTLFNQICSHPEVYPAFFKETHFFNNDSLYSKGIEYYFNHFFRGAESYKCKGEATPAYLRKSEIVIPRMKENLDFDAIKFIFLLRDPVKRAWSHYLHRKRSLNEDLSFKNALELEKQRIKDGEDFSGYYHCGLYGEQCSQWLKHIPKNNYLFIKQEDLYSQRDKTLVKVFNFLGVTPDTVIEKNRSLNKAGAPKYSFIMKIINNPHLLGKSILKKILPLELRRELKTRIRQWNVASFTENNKPQLDPLLEKELRKKYLADIITLEKLTGWNCSDWKSNEKSS